MVGSRGLTRSSNWANVASGSFPNSRTIAQRRPEETRTSLASALRCSQKSLLGLPGSKSWWACLSIATCKPRATSAGITRTSKVVLSDPLQPARPITRMPEMASQPPITSSAPLLQCRQAEPCL